MTDDTAGPVPAGPAPPGAPPRGADRVRLRAMTTEDLPAVVEQSTDPETVRWTTVPSPYDLDAARDFLDLHAEGWAREHGTRHWVVELLPRDGAAGLPFAGTIDLRPDPQGGAWETGYALHPAARGRAVMSSALRLAARWAFDHGAPSLHWWAERGNFASWRVARACGFTHHGTLPARIAHRASFSTDAWVASLLPDQPMSAQTPWIEPPALEEDGIRLRPLREDDVAMAEPHAHQLHHIPARAVPTPETFDGWLLRLRERMSRGHDAHWGIADLDSDEPLGEVLVFVDGGVLRDGGTAELGYWIRPSARGRGLARRAARLASDHALRPMADGGLGLRRLVAETAADNAASNRVLEAAGFSVWGREDSAEAPDGSWGPALHWERLA